MIKVNAALSKKLPIPGVQYSSQEFSAGIEAEIGHQESSEQIKATIRRLYALVGEAIDEQVKQAGADSQAPAKAPEPGRRSYPRNRAYRNASGNGRHVPATEAQKKCIFAICETLGLNADEALASRGLPELDKLGIKEASALIDELKRLETAGN
ncbi:MAG: hypothetical protein M5U26_12590 [Planctomycetota bacterium]|nr:hypothetical protein [Planctomycetota bacterium]